MKKSLYILNGILLISLFLISLWDTIQGEGLAPLSLMLVSLIIVIISLTRHERIENENIEEVIYTYQDEVENLRNKADKVDKLMITINKLCANKLGFSNEVVDKALKEDFGISLDEIYEKEQKKYKIKSGIKR